MTNRHFAKLPQDFCTMYSYKMLYKALIKQTNIFIVPIHIIVMVIALFSLELHQ